MSAFDAVPTVVRIVEVGPRDGLQNVADLVSTTDKVHFIELLAAAGLTDIEATSFVSPRAIPQLSDASDVMTALHRAPGVRYGALVPNQRGLQRAMQAHVDQIALFTGATDGFTRHNIGMSIQESLETFAPLVQIAQREGIAVRGYVSVCFGCPYEGAVTPLAVLDVARRLLDLGVRELSLGDTIGVATPNQVPDVVGPVLEVAGPSRVAAHFHDTRGAAPANVLASLLLGVAIYDSSAGGLGGCPYAPGAAGNVATEDLLYLLHGMGITTGVDIDKMTAASAFILGVLHRAPTSRYLQASWQAAPPDLTVKGSS